MEQDTFRLDVQTDVQVEENYDRKVIIKLENVEDNFTLVDVNQIMKESYLKQESIHEESCKIEAEDLYSEETDKSVDITTSNVNQKHLSAGTDIINENAALCENNSGIIKCEMCNKLFVLETDLKQHMFCHTVSCFTTINMENQRNDDGGLTAESKCNCLIEAMLKRRFALIPFNEKDIIVKSPKPTPMLSIQSQAKPFKRHFNRKIYENIAWICGCAHLLKLFCWPCILFSQEENAWNKYGYSDLNNLSQACKRHECSQSHICSTVQFKRFANGARIEDCFSAQFKENIAMHNREVTANRYILSKLISAICFLTKQELPSENHESDNRSHYVELLYLLSESDLNLKLHLENSTVFTGTLDHIQNDLISSISKVLRDEIKSEIRASKCVSVIVNESTDLNRTAQLCTVVRYVDENNEIQERFVGFVDASPDRTADALFQCISKTLQEFECLDKIIAHTYDGAAVMPGGHNEVQRKIRSICPNSLFVHCYAHGLNLVLSQSVTHIAECKRFFKHLLSVSSFFSKSSKRISLLDCEIKKRSPTAAPTQWNHNSRILNMVFEYQKELLEIFERIMTDEDDWDNDAIINAEVLHRYLKDFEFNFHLHLFSAIFHSADFLFDILQKKTFDISYCMNEIRKFGNVLDCKQDDFDSFWNKLMTAKLNRKRKDAECVENMKMTYKRLYSRILETLLVDTTNRFRDMENLKFMELFNVNKFNEYEKNFPDFLFKSLQRTYGKYFDFVRLKSELIYMYSTADFHLKSINCIKKIIVNDELQDVLAQVFDLIQLICTIPSSCASVERTLSTMKTIKTLRRSEDGLSALALITIENELLLNLKNKGNLYEAVIDEFCRKERRIKLIFKK